MRLRRSSVPPQPLPRQVLSVWRRLRGGFLSPQRAALTIGVGLFVGFLPVYGIQLLFCLAICLPLRLDFPLAYLAAHVSNPLTLPFILALEVEVGALLLTGEHAGFSIEQARELGFAGLFAQALLGSVVVGTLVAVVGGGITYALVASRAGSFRDAVDDAVSRTVARYSGASRGDRTYVSVKLRTDPVLRDIADLDLSLGDVIDAGCGRGQLGLALLELGRVRALRGVDWDARKISVASAAAGADATFEEGSLPAFAWPPADTVLFVDSLHYMPKETQDEVLRSAADALRPGGRLIVREVDAVRGWRSSVTIALEYLAGVIRYNRGRGFAFRSAADLVATLETLGLECVSRPPNWWDPLNNVLIVATRRQSQAS